MADNKKGLNTAWTKHLQGSAKQDFEGLVRNSTQLLQRLKDILQEKESEITQTQFSLNDFDSPSWAMKTAWRNGQLALLKQMKELIPF